MDLRRLADPFSPEDVEWRVQQAGKTREGKVWALVLAYINNRAIMERLDEVCGPENWCNEFIQGPGGGVLCAISVKIGGEWVKKWDGAENTDVEAVKGGLSGAMKRAGVQWSIGRYLYHLEETFATIAENGSHRGKLSKEHGGEAYRWNPPRLPAWALPGGAGKPSGASAASRSQQRDLDLMLEFIRDVGARCQDDTTVTFGGKKHPLRDYVRANWPQIKENYDTAASVARAIEASTGETFRAANP
jgi:hypothetical protein